MTELTTYTTYTEYKAQLDRAITETTQDFVVIGHLLMQARDTDILSSSGYTSMGDFARSEYGLDESVTSRFINIAEKYGDGSGRLKAEYAAYTYSKLGEMLTLPSEVAAIVTPDMTVKDIREIKSEVQEEEKISDVEVMIEAAGQPEGDILEEFFKSYLENRPEEFIAIGKAEDTEDVYDILAPQGRATLIARVPGTGKIMISIESMEDVKVVYVRENRTEELAFKDIDNAIMSLIGTVPFPEQRYKDIYGKDPEIEEAPKKPEKVKTSKPKTKPKPDPETKPEIKAGPKEEPEPEIATSQKAEKLLEKYDDMLKEAQELLDNLNKGWMAAAHKNCKVLEVWLDKVQRIPANDIQAELSKKYDND